MGQDSADGRGASTAAFINTLERLVGSEKYGIWFGRMSCVQTNSGVELEFPNSHYIEWVQRDHHDELVFAARQTFGSEARVVLSNTEEPHQSVRLDAPETRASGQHRAEGYTIIPNRWLDELQPRLGLVPWGVFEAHFGKQTEA